MREELWWDATMPGAPQANVAWGACAKKRSNGCGRMDVLRINRPCSGRVSPSRSCAALRRVLEAYQGPRLTQTPEGIMPVILTTRGLIAGCPAAPILAKVAPATPCQTAVSNSAAAGADLWIDDIRVDIESKSLLLQPGMRSGYFGCCVS